MGSGKVTVGEKTQEILAETRISLIESVESLALSDFYRTDRGAPGAVSIGFIDDTFRSLMANVREPVTMPAGRLGIYRLKDRANVREIINAVAPARRFNSFAEAAARMSILLRKQPEGQAGTLPTNHNATLFVFPEGVASCIWTCGFVDWQINAYLPDGPGMWGYGRLVISC